MWFNLYLKFMRKFSDYDQVANKLMLSLGYDEYGNIYISLTRVDSFS